jgi:glycosyltransferase involved in cell wall biosynthesis
VVLNQSHSPAFQAILGRLAAELGPCLLVSGSAEAAVTEGELTVRLGPRYDRRGLAARAASWLRFLGVAAAHTVTLRGRPFLLVVTNPPMLPHLAWLLSRLRHRRYALLIWDIYPDHLVAMGWMGPRHPLVKLWRRLNRWALRSAELVITLGDRMAETLEAQLGADRSKARLEVIPNWANIDTLQPVPKAENTFAVEHGQVGVVTVLYSGNMGASHDLMPVIEAADRLRADPRVRFLNIGDGLGRPALEREVNRRKLENVQIVDYQPWSMLPLSLASGDIAVVTQRQGTEHLSMPSKTYSALAVGSAILALTEPDSDLARLVREHRVGRVCRRDDPAAIAGALRELLDHPERLQRMQVRARRLAEREFSEDAVYHRLLEVLRPLVVGRREA